MRVNKLVVNNAIKVITNDLGIQFNQVELEFINDKDKALGLCGRIKKGLYQVCINLARHDDEDELLCTIAHELRHVWQGLQGWDAIGGNSFRAYKASYNLNVLELDAERYAEIMVYGKQYKANVENMYFSMVEIMKFGAHMKYKELVG